MNRYSIVQRLLFRIKFSIVWFLKKILPGYFFDRWIEPFWYGLKDRIYKLHYWLVVSSKLKKRQLVVFVSGEWMTPGHVYRVERYVETFRSLGFLTFWFKPSSLVANIEVLDRCTLLIIWRAVLDPKLEKIIARAKELEAKIVYDLDDLMFYPEMARKEIIDGIRTMELDEKFVVELYSGINKAMQKADFCTSPTDYLATHLRKQGKATFVLPNGFSHENVETAIRLQSGHKNDDGKIRIGYAGGTKTHQKDFAVALPALLHILKNYPRVILVVFGEALLLEEFTELKPFLERIEIRKLVPMEKMPKEIFRFDINIAPLDISDFTESKSELKYFEAALLMVPTVATPTEPYRKVIENGVNGFLAGNTEEWINALESLVRDEDLRRKTGKRAFYQALYFFGPQRRINLTFEFLQKIGLSETPEISHLKSRRQALQTKKEISYEVLNTSMRYPEIPDYQIIKAYCNSKTDIFARVGVIIPLYNYEQYIESALNSLTNQTLKEINLVVIDDASGDASASVVLKWLENNHQRFKYAALIRNPKNEGLARSRNAGFDHIRSHYIMQLDADNELLPKCLELCANALENSGASMAYPQIEMFGADKNYILDTYQTATLGFRPWNPKRIAEGNYIDAMAMVCKSAWADAGGYDATFVHKGWEDYDMWLKFIERGHFGVNIPEIAARYRVHMDSMIRENPEISYAERRKEIFEKHPWVKKYEYSGKT
jgi:GT2 family glycosyltransferase/glycosyltransferase involved in cell wall biosynthesis